MHRKPVISALLLFLAVLAAPLFESIGQGTGKIGPIFVVPTQAEFYIFRFGCLDGDEWIYTPWMDERLCSYGTFVRIDEPVGGRQSIPTRTGSRTVTALAQYLSHLDADEVVLQLRSVDDKLPAHIDMGAETRSSARLLRKFSSVDSGSLPEWQVGTDCGPPNEVLISVHSIYEIETITFSWNGAYPDQYWVVLWEHYRDSPERWGGFVLEATYTEPGGYVHRFSAVPTYGSAEY